MCVCACVCVCVCACVTLTFLSLVSGRHGDSGYWPSDNNPIDMSSLNGENDLI